MLQARDLARGVSRHFHDLGYATLYEFTLPNHRRADVMGLGGKGEIAIIEVKSSLADFQSDNKWPEYLDFCDRFYFAVSEEFPRTVLPEDQGLVIADAYQASIIRDASPKNLPPARRKALHLRIARTSAQRLFLFTDPPLE